LNSKSEILKKVNAALNLEKSTSKLRWYINNKSDINELFKEAHLTDEFLTDEFSKAKIQIKQKLTSYTDIISTAKSQIEFPLEVKAGIYCLVKDDKIVYVGSAKNLLNRFSGHVYKEKDFNRIWFEFYDEGEIRKVEACYIWYLNYPKYNKNAGENDFIVSELLRLSGHLIE